MVGKFGLRKFGADALAEARHLGAARDIAEHLPGRIDVPEHADLGAPQAEGAAAVDVAIGREVDLLVAHGKEILRARHERDIRHEVERVLRIGRIVLRLLQQRRRRRCLEAADIDELLGVDGAVEDIEAGDEPIAVTADDPVVGRPWRSRRNPCSVVEPLEDRMHQVAVDAEHADLEHGIVEADGGLVGDADGIDVALPVVEDVDRRRRLRRGQRGGLGRPQPGMRCRTSLALK